MNNRKDFRSVLVELAEGEGWGGETWDHRRGEHPPADLLVAYGSGELVDLVDEDPRLEALRDHVATCRECASLVADLATFPNLPRADGEPSEEEMAEVWQKLRQRLYREEVLPADEEEPAAAADHPRIRAVEELPWDRGVATPSSPRRPDPRPASTSWRSRSGWLVAAALLVLCVGLASWAAHLDRHLAVLTAPQPNVPLVDLDDGRTRSGPAEVVEAQLRGPYYLLIFYPVTEVGSEERFTGYSWRIVDESGEVRLEGTDLELQPGRYFTLLLYREALPPGSYRVRIFGHGTDGGEPVPVGEQELRIPEAG